VSSACGAHALCARQMPRECMTHEHMDDDGFLMHALLDDKD
jgi:hypothetical protein